MSKAPVATLNNGEEMPLLGFGVYQLGDPAKREAALPPAVASRVMSHALERAVELSSPVKALISEYYS